VITGRSQDRVTKPWPSWVGRPRPCSSRAMPPIDQRRRAIGTWSHGFGRIDILVNNVGGATAFAPIAAMDDQTWEQGLSSTSRVRSMPRARHWGRCWRRNRVDHQHLSVEKHGKPFIVQYVTPSTRSTDSPRVCQRGWAEGITVNALCRARRHRLGDRASRGRRALGRDHHRAVSWRQYAAESASKRVTPWRKSPSWQCSWPPTPVGINGANDFRRRRYSGVLTTPSRENVSRRPPLNAHF